MHGWSDKRSEPDSRHPRNCTRGDINKTIKLADSRITFPPPTFLHPSRRTVSFYLLLSFPFLPASFPPLFQPSSGGASWLGSGVWRARQFAFLNVREPVYVGEKEEEEEERRGGYVHTATNLDLLDGCCFLFTPFPPLFTRRLPLSLVWIRHPLLPKEGVDQWERRRRERKYSARFRQFSRV